MQWSAPLEWARVVGVCEDAQYVGIEYSVPFKSHIADTYASDRGVNR